MNVNSFTSRHLAAGAVACSTIVMFALPAGADNYPPLEPMITNGLTGAPPGFPNNYWNVSSGFTTPLIDETGQVTVSGRIFGDGVTILNNRILLRGDANGWNLLYRYADPMPGLPGFVPANMLTSDGFGYNISGTGSALHLISGITGTGVVAANDSAMWSGLPTSLSFIAREGVTEWLPTVALNGNGGGVVASNGTRINNAGESVFYTNLANVNGGTSVVPANNAAILRHGPGGFTKVWRRGDIFVGGPMDGTGMNPNNAGISLNASNAVSYTGSLIVGTGTPAVTGTDDAVMVVTDGAGVTRVVAREDANYPPLCNLGPDPSPEHPEDDVLIRYRRTSSFTPAQRAINNGGKTLFQGMIEGYGTGAHGVTTSNDAIWFVDTGSGDPLIAMRENELVSTGMYHLTANFAAILINNNDRLAFAGTCNTGPATPTLNGIWTGPIEGLKTLVAKGGDLLPGTTDVNMTLTSSGTNLTFNNADQVIFTTDLTGAGVTVGVNDRAIMGWDPVQGLIVITRNGVTTVPGLLNTSLISVGGAVFQTGDNGCSYFTDNGWLVLRVQDVKGFNSIVRCRPFALPCTADTDGNNVVDVLDLLAVINAWGACADPNDCPEDTDNNDMVDVLDLLAVINNWGSCP